jgi:sigma-B regulation protein RsbU (phosphoserine phosphatase)
MVRYTLRAEAAHEPRPGQLLGLLNDAIRAQRSDYLFCTGVCVRLDLAGGHAALTLAGGGHPMPLIVRQDGRVEPPSDPGGPLVGVWADAEFDERRYSLLPGESLVIYTDGLLEAHAPERILTPQELARLASGIPRQPLGSFLRALESVALGSSIERSATTSPSSPSRSPPHGAQHAFQRQEGRGVGQAPTSRGVVRSAFAGQPIRPLQRRPRF